MTTTTPETIALPVESRSPALPAARALRRGLRRRARSWRSASASARCTPTTSSTSAGSCPASAVGAVDLSGLDAGRRGRSLEADVRRPVRGRARAGRAGRPDRPSPTPSSAAAPTSTRWSPRRWPSVAPATPSSGSSPTPAPRCAASTLTPTGHLRRRAHRRPHRRPSPCASTGSPTDAAVVPDRRGPPVHGRARPRRPRRSMPAEPSPRRSPRSARSTRRRASALDLVDHARRADDHDRRGVQRQGPVRSADRAASPWPSRTSRSPSTSRPRALRTWTTVRADRRWRLRADARHDAIWSPTLEQLAKKIDRAPVNASFKTSGGSITGVTPSKNGYKLDVAGTQAAVLARPRARGQTGAVSPRSSRPSQVTKPVLTTAEAEAARPKMKKISQLDDVLPDHREERLRREHLDPGPAHRRLRRRRRARTFDFWDAVGPVTRAKGYKDGGAIINGRTEPQGALAGGICSCSTTLFNAALRAGYEMGARRNHYYYIDRYPLGLDATVFISALRLEADDVVHQRHRLPDPHPRPRLARGRLRLRPVRALQRPDRPQDVSSAGPIVRDVRPGRRQRPVHVEPAGRHVASASSTRSTARRSTVTRTVRDRNGNVIHKDTYFSNYARITGIVLDRPRQQHRRPRASSRLRRSARGLRPRATGRAIPGRWPPPRSR